MATSPDPAAESSAEFEGRIQKIINDGFTVPCIAIGSKMGLFDKMAALGKPVTSEELAEAMGYKERYVREWLNSMVSIRVFDVDASAGTYFFPPSRHALFTAEGGMHNLANITQGLTLSCQVYNELQTCFLKDGPRGIPYDHYVGFHQWKEDQVKIQFPEAYLRSIFEKEPGLLARLESGMSVCDMGCGPGVQIHRLAKMFPNSTFHGCDISTEAIQMADSLNQQNPLPNLSFSVRDISELPEEWSERFDLVTVFDVIHDLPYASKTLRHIHRVLRPGGLFYMMDVTSSEDHQLNPPLLYTFSLFHCMAQSLYHEGSEGLGVLWGPVKAKAMISEAGFAAVRDLPFPVSLHMHMIADKN
jgi:ubiquinone/menaquinone biosynthesis C-methylase UbiE